MNPPTTPTTVTLATALASSMSPWVPKMRFMPLSGSSFSSFGASALPEKIQPPRATGETRATTSMISANGSTASSPSPKSSAIISCGALGLNTISRSRRSPSSMIAATWLPMWSPRA